jgi:hypothetical protein
VLAPLPILPAIALITIQQLDSTQLSIQLDYLLYSTLTHSYKVPSFCHYFSHTERSVVGKALAEVQQSPNGILTSVHVQSATREVFGGELVIHSQLCGLHACVRELACVHACSRVLVGFISIHIADRLFDR